MVGRNWARPTASAACTVTSRGSITNPSASSPANSAAAPGAASRPINASPPSWASKSKPDRTAPRKSVGWSNTSRPCPIAASASAASRCGLWSPLACWRQLGGAPRGQKEWSLFAKGLSQVQRRALGIRQQADGYPAPGATTFWRLLAHLDAAALEKIFLQVQAQIRSPAPPEELIVLDGKTPRHGGGHSVLTAVPAPSQHYLGSAIVDQKTNEIPGERELFKKLALDGRKVSRDARHTQDQTARELLLEQGADFLLTVQANPPTLRANIQRLVPAPPARVSPREATATLAGRRASNKSPCCAATCASTPRKPSRWSPACGPKT